MVDKPEHLGQPSDRIKTSKAFCSKNVAMLTSLTGSAWPGNLVLVFGTSLSLVLFSLVAALPISSRTRSVFRRVASDTALQQNSFDPVHYPFPHKMGMRVDNDAHRCVGAYWRKERAGG